MQDKARHAGIVEKLSKDINKTFDQALEEEDPHCRQDQDKDGKWPVNPWSDWSSNDDDQPDMPSRQQARLMCSPCKLQVACLEWAMATGLHHGVAGGERFENGVMVK